MIYDISGDEFNAMLWEWIPDLSCNLARMIEELGSNDNKNKTFRLTVEEIEKK